MLYARRKRWEKENNKIGEFFSRASLSPNYWTFASVILSLVTAYFVVNGSFVLAALFFALTALMDIVDGSVARYLGLATKKGAYLDTMVDRYAEFFVIAALLLANLPDFYLPISFWIFVYLFGSLMTTYSKAAAKEKDLTSVEIKGGILERSERMILLFLGLLLAVLSKTYLTYIIVLVAVLSNITVLQRASKAYNQKSGKMEKNVQTGNRGKKRP